MWADVAPDADLDGDAVLLQPAGVRGLVLAVCVAVGPAGAEGDVLDVFTTDSPPIHHRFTTDSPPIHHRFTTDSPPIHHRFTTDSPPIHHRFTTDDPGNDAIVQVEGLQDVARLSGVRGLIGSLRITGPALLTASWPSLRTVGGDLDAERTTRLRRVAMPPGVTSAGAVDVAFNDALPIIVVDGLLTLGLPPQATGWLDKRQRREGRWPMAGKTELRRNINQCPWQNYPTHRRNKQLQCHGDLPLSYGYCSQDLGCPSCAGTLYKPNILLEQGRPFVFVECPCCDPEGFRRRVERLKDKLPKGAGPTSTPITEQKKAADDVRRHEDAMARRAERLKRLK